MLARSALHSDRDLGAWRIIEQYASEIAAVTYRGAVDRDNDITLRNTRLLSWALSGGIVGEAGDQHSTLHRQVIRCGQLRSDIFALNAQETLTGRCDVPAGDKLIHHIVYPAGGNGKTNTIGLPAGLAVRLAQSWNSHQLALQIYQRSAAVTRIDGRARLDQAGQRCASSGCHLRSQCG